jgi:rubredoxin
MDAHGNVVWTHDHDEEEEAETAVPVLPVTADEVWKCKVCGHVYNASADGKGMTFEDLPASWVCPVCGAPKSSYAKQMTSDGHVVWSHD